MEKNPRSTDLNLKEIRSKKAQEPGEKKKPRRVVVY